MALIKSQSVPSAAPYQWRDIEAEARQLIDDAKQRSETLLQQAQVAAETLTETARAEGYRRAFRRSGGWIGAGASPGRGQSRAGA